MVSEEPNWPRTKREPLALRLLVSIEQVWLLIGKLREDTVEFLFDRSMPEHQYVLRVD